MVGLEGWFCHSTVEYGYDDHWVDYSHGFRAVAEWAWWMVLKCLWRRFYVTRFSRNY